MNKKIKNNDDDFQTGISWNLWKNIIHYCKPYRKHIIALIIIMIAFAIIDSIIPLLTRYAIDNFAIPKKTKGIPLFCLTIIIVAFIRGLTNFLMIVVGGKMNTSINYDIRRDCFNHIQKLSYSYFDKHPIGWLMSRLTSDSTKLSRTMTWGMVDLVWAPAMMILMTIIMLIINWKLAILVLATVPVIFIITILFQKIILEKFRLTRKINSEITASFNEGISGAKTTKTLVREIENLNEFNQTTTQMYNASTSAARYSAIYLPIILIIATCGTALTLWIGGKGIINNTISYGTLVAFLAYVIQFLQPIQDLARRFPEFQSAQASAERIISLLQTKPQIEDKPNNQKTPIIKTIKQISFNNISFHYNPKEPILKNFNLQVEAKQTIALVGDTGAGKTTIINLLCRFYQPTTGTITINNHNYQNIPLKQLQSYIGIVPQTPHLFSGTIAENIRYGRLDASEEQIKQAAEQANATQFINNLPQKFNTQVGENGSNLSTGQKQLIAIARIIIRNPQIIILDEATSSVDTQTEKLIQKAINQTLKNKTSFIIAHRLSTIKNAHRILLLRNGKIIEDGNHHELILKKEEYYKLYTSQFINEKENELLT